MLSKIPTLSWVQSHVRAIMGWKVQQRWLEDTLHQLFRRVQEIEGRGKKKKSCFCISVPPASGDNTQNRCTLRFNSLSKRLLFVPLCFFSFFYALVVFIHPSLHISPYLWRLPQPLTNNNALPVGTVWWPTLHSLWVAVRWVYMLCAHKLQCKWLEQKEGTAVRGLTWKRVPL